MALRQNYADSVYSTCGTVVSVKHVGTTIAIDGAYAISDLGGQKGDLQITPLASRYNLVKGGLQELEPFAIDYYYNERDFDALNALRYAGGVSEITVRFPSGKEYKCLCKIKSNYSIGRSAHGMIAARAVFLPREAWRDSTSHDDRLGSGVLGRLVLA